MDNLIFTHGGNIYEIKKKVVDFSANINPFGIPSKVKNKIYNKIDNIIHYPDPSAKDLIIRISQYWNIKEDNILLGNGSVELIYLIMSVFTPKTVSIPIPAFSEYERAAKTVNSKLNFFRLKEKDGFKITPSNIHRSEIIVLPNPNNPTGNLIFTNNRVIEKLQAKLILIDEAFMDFVSNERDYSLIWKAAKERKIIVLRTFTKFFALPGLRIGYLIANKEIIKLLKRHQAPWSTNVLAQFSAEKMLDENFYIKKTKLFIEREREFLFKKIREIKGLKPYPSITNFLLLKIDKKGLNANNLKKKLLLKGILVRDCSNFRGLNKKFIRIAIRTREENLMILNALDKII